MQASARLSSSAASKRVIAGVSSTATRSCCWTCRWRSHAAPLSAQEPPAKGNKITKQARIVRIKEFVDKYKASNEGKFPTITAIRQQVGGCHYTVRGVLQELQYNQANLPPDSAMEAQHQGTAEVADHSRPKDELRPTKLQGTAEFTEISKPKDEPKAVHLQGTNKVDKHSGSKDESKAAQLKGPAEVSECSRIMEKTENLRSAGSSHYAVEIEGAKHDSNTSGASKNADGPTLSDQTKSDGMKVLMDDHSISVGVDSKLESGNQQGEGATKSDLSNTENSLNASESTLADQSGSDKVIEENIHDREREPRHEFVSKKTGLLGSLKSLAYGISNFWKKL